VDAVIDYLPSPLDVPGAEGLEVGSTETSFTLKPATTINFAHSLSNFGPILTPASWYSSASIPVTSRKVITFTIRARANASASAALMVIQGSERKDINEVYAGDIAALVGLRKHHQPATRCAMKITT